MTFSRGFTDNQIAALGECQWFRELLSFWIPDGYPTGERRLRLAIRADTMNFYLRGQSVAQVGFSAGQPYALVHVKYAYGEGVEKGSPYARLRGDQIPDPIRKTFTTYEPGKTIRRWIAGAAAYESFEKERVDRIYSDNVVLDVEMGLPRYEEQDAAKMIDLVTLHAIGKTAVVRFWEVKRYVDERLRRGGEAGGPEVIDQLKNYKRFLNKEGHAKQVLDAYEGTCANLAALEDQANLGTAKKIKLNRAVREVGEGKKLLTLDPVPRLIVVGSKAQLSSTRWAGDKAALSDWQIVELADDPYALPPVQTLGAAA